MYTSYVAEAFSIATQLRYQEARNALTQPDITVKNLGAETEAPMGFGFGGLGTIVARLEVTVPGAEPKIVHATPREIDCILADTDFPKGASDVRTTLCQAKEAAMELHRADEVRHAENGAKTRAWFKRWFF